MYAMHKPIRLHAYTPACLAREHPQLACLPARLQLWCALQDFAVEGLG